MLTDTELEQLLADLESDRVERKESISDLNRIKQAICAFANDMAGHNQPGVVFIGVRDNGTCANFTITDQVLLTLAHIRSDGNILPLPSMVVQKRVIAGCELAAVVVEPSHYPPIRFDGRIWIRVGPRRAIASEEEERRLIERRRARNLPWDLQAMPAASMNDLNIELFEHTYLPSAISADVLKQNHRTPEQQLMSLRFLSVDGVPTVVGLLTIGKSPVDFLPGAYVQFLRIAGKDLYDPILDQKNCRGPVAELLPEIDDILHANTKVATDITSNEKEVRRLDYPIAALQQLVRNAIMHRDYQTSNAPVRITWFEDRVEIQNPGGPYGQVTVDNFADPGITDYRNPNLAETLRTLGFVQRFGVGISIAKRQLAENGNPPPEFLPRANHVRVIVRRSA